MDFLLAGLLIPFLDSENFSARNNANIAVSKMGMMAHPALSLYSKQNTTLEFKTRVNRLLVKMPELLFDDRCYDHLVGKFFVEDGEVYEISWIGRTFSPFDQLGRLEYMCKKQGLTYNFGSGRLPEEIHKHFRSK